MNSYKRNAEQIVNKILGVPFPFKKPIGKGINLIDI